MIVVLSKFFAPYRHELFSHVADRVLYAYSSDGHRSWGSNGHDNAWRLFTIRSRKTEYSFLWPRLKLVKILLTADTLVVNSLFLFPVWIIQLMRGRKIIYMTDVHPLYAPKIKLKIYSIIFTDVVTNVPVSSIHTKVIPLTSQLDVSQSMTERHIDVLFVNQLVERKNIDFIRRFILEASDLRICIIGDGTYFPELERSNVEWLKSIDYQEMGKYYQSAKILCAPSYFDVWGLNVQEALMCGCYVISTKSLGAAYYFANLSPVFILESYDESAWRVSIEKIIAQYSPPPKLNLSEFQLNKEFLRNAINILYSR